jgi:hypothetical protein
MRHPERQTGLSLTTRSRATSAAELVLRATLVIQGRREKVRFNNLRRAT